MYYFGDLDLAGLQIAVKPPSRPGQRAFRIYAPLRPATASFSTDRTHEGVSCQAGGKWAWCGGPVAWLVVLPGWVVLLWGLFRVGWLVVVPGAGVRGGRSGLASTHPAAAGGGGGAGLP